MLGHRQEIEETWAVTGKVTDHLVYVHDAVIGRGLPARVVPRPNVPTATVQTGTTYVPVMVTPIPASYNTQKSNITGNLMIILNDEESTDAAVWLAAEDDLNGERSAAEIAAGCDCEDHDLGGHDAPLPFDMGASVPHDWFEDMQRRCEELGLAPPAPRPKPVPAGIKFDADLIPSNGPTTAVGDSGMDTLIDGLDIIDAYTRWCGKMTPDPGGKRESIMVSCPDPRHRDSNPSAWINLDNQTWFCGGCQIGGDKYDIAAHGLGFDVPAYKDKHQFPDLRRQMAAALGYTVRKTAGGQEIVTRADSPQPVEAPPANSPQPVAPLAEVIPINATPDPETGEPAGGWPAIDWRSLVPEGTFLRKWMEACAKDDLPEEYYFWLGLQAISMAIGDDVTFNDTIPVKGNLYVCLLGTTGMGKSRAIRALEHVLREAIPYSYDDPHSKGACLIANPGSAEALVDEFSRPIFEDPVDPLKITGYGHVRGLLKIPELSDLVASGRRSGNKIKPMLIDLYDAPADVKITSRTAGTVIADQPYCSVVTSTQPGAIKDLIAHGDAASGFANRWIFVAGTPKKRVALGRGPLDLTGTLARWKPSRAGRAPGRSST